MHPKQVTQVSGQQKNQENRRQRKHQTDQPLGQYVQGHGGGDAPAQNTRRPFLFERSQKKVEAQGHPQANGHVGDQDARKDKRTKAGSESQRGIESAFFAIEAASEAVDDQQQGQHAQSDG